jgi:uncharacterized membrane protein
MGKGRFEAFSDGVIAIIITIMVLELKVPHGADLAALQAVDPRVPQLCAELRLCRHLLEQPPPHAARGDHGDRADPVGQPAPAVLAVADPVHHGWMGENHMAAVPVALYGVVLMMCAIAFTLLARMMARHEGADSSLARAIGKDRKTLASTGSIWPASAWPSSIRGSRWPATSPWR